MAGESAATVLGPSNNRSGIGLLTCLSLVTATMVGTGVYTTLGFQLQDLRSGFSILCLWIAGGVIALCGALSYAELAARIPRSGGEYTYLSEIYHPALGFMAAFVSLIAGFAAPIALSAMAFGSYLHAAFPSCSAHNASFLSVILISLIHLRSLSVSSFVQVASTLLKFLLAGLFIAAGFWSLAKHPEGLDIVRPHGESFAELLHPSSGIALIFVLYAYSGWNAVNYLAGEVREGRRLVGLSLVLGTVAVALFYVALNTVFLTSAPTSELRGVLNVGSVATAHLIGPSGGRVMSAIIAFGLLASISAMIWAGPRVTQRVGEDYPALAWLGERTVTGIPRRAILLQLLLVLGLIAGGTFETVLLFAQTPLLLCLILGVAGILVLRFKQASPSALNFDGRPSENFFKPRFTCPIFPLPPLVFIFCSGAGLIYSALCKPWIAFAGVTIMLLPLLFYRWLAPPKKP
jgi:APA family basic amino acid/polyamine antiporter